MKWKLSTANCEKCQEMSEMLAARNNAWEAEIADEGVWQPQAKQGQGFGGQFSFGGLFSEQQGAEETSSSDALLRSPAL